MTIKKLLLVAFILTQFHFVFGHQCKDTFSKNSFFTEGRIITSQLIDINADLSFGVDGIYLVNLRRLNTSTQVLAYFSDPRLERKFDNLRYPSTDKALQYFASGKLELIERLDGGRGFEFVLVLDRLWQKDPKLNFEEGNHQVIPFPY